ncbi:hypothetical protein BGX34_005207 [Mortierella sp. NVP85]|nr:hypothetical protein BGX34_005207 [Mortierella sp. NVP85]
MNLVYSLLLLFFSVAAVLVQGEHPFDEVTSSKAMFTGIDYFEYDPGHNTPQDIYRHPRNRAAAAASLLVGLSKESAFQPKEGLIKDVGILWPFEWNLWHHKGLLHNGESLGYVRVGGSRDQFKKSIAAVFNPRIVRADIAASALVDQIPQLTEWKFNGHWHLELFTIHAEGEIPTETNDDGEEEEEDTYKVTLEWTTLRDLRIFVHSDGSVTFPVSENATLHQRFYTVNVRELKENARQYADHFGWSTVENFVDQLTTPKSKNHRVLDDWCSGPDDVCERETQAPKCEHPHCQSSYRLPQIRMG